MRTLWRRTSIAAIILASSLGASAVNAQSRAPLVFAAASLKNALDDAASAYAAMGKAAPRISFAGSSALARQIEQGAPADIFISADTRWMDHLAKLKLIRPETRSDLLGNSIVIVAPANSGVQLPAITGERLLRALGGGRLAVADVNAVPAGRYAKTSLEQLGAWEAVQSHLAQSENVRAALLFVSRGEAPLGVVYRTDATADPKVRIVATLPRDSHPPIIYPAALLRTSAHPDAASFLAFLRSPQARPPFEKQGFTLLETAAAK